MREMTQAEFASKCGVSAAAISKAVKKNRIKITEDKKVDPLDPINITYLSKRNVQRGGKAKPPPSKVRKKIPPCKTDAEILSDLHKPKFGRKPTGDKEYDEEREEEYKTNAILDSLKQKNLNKYEPPEEQSGSDKDEADLLKTKAQTAKIHMEMAKIMGDLIVKDGVKKILGDMAQIFNNMMIPMGDRLGQEICDLLGVSDEEKIIRVTTTINDENARIIEAMKRVEINVSTW